MGNDLHYSPQAIVRRSGWMLLATAVVLGDYVVHANGGFPHVWGFGVVPSAVLIMTSLYFVGATMLLTLGLIRHGGIAISASETGISFHSAWTSRDMAWRDLSRINLEVRYTKTQHYTVIACHEASGLFRCHAIDTRLLSEPLDRISEWVDAGERQRLKRGGVPFVAPMTGLAGYNARNQASDIATDIAEARHNRAA